MLNHVVLIKFKKNVSEKDIQELENLLEELPNKIFEIHSFEFGRDIIHSDRSYDFALFPVCQHRIPATLSGPSGPSNRSEKILSICEVS